MRRAPFEATYAIAMKGIRRNIPILSSQWVWASLARARPTSGIWPSRGQGKCVDSETRQSRSARPSSAAEIPPAYRLHPES